MKEFDAIVVGAGSGLDIASAYANRGKDVAVVEPGPLGGTCLNRGCIPSKMLIHRADIVEEIQGSEKFHIDAEVNSVDFSSIVEEVNSSVSEDAESIRKGVKGSKNHTLYETEAEFVDEKVLDVNGEKITAEQIFVAAGTRPMIPPVDGLDEVDYMTSREALKQQEQPESMVIVGGGYIAVEMAHFYGALGTEITIIEMGDSLVGREDEEVSEKYTELAREKYDVNLGLKASKVEEVGGQKKVVAEDENGNKHSFAAEKLLVAAGRVPNTDRLSVDEAGIETDDRGFVETDEYLETSVKGIYAIGDIAGNFLFKHSANLEAKYAYRNAIS
ncbi:MAG: FAD-dependent oxidoreductase, partial [Candidatus Nanohaloarchaea archaeon]